MTEVSRQELNGLGKKVTKDREDFVECRAEKEATLKSLTALIDTQAENQTRIFQAQEDTKVALSGLKGWLIGIGAVLGVVSPIITAVVIHFLRG
jgi:hypothetical protein